ncbi:TPA: hypothetical protein DF272_06405 [Candidatus Falkowbacteria bacterium]|nr:hypothetical protein [Candidatus Falkowbacteria bacterium]
MIENNDYNQEDRYADELHERREEKRGRIPEPHDRPEKKKRLSLSCGVLLAVILGLSFYLIYFVWSQLSGPLKDEWAKRKVDWEKLPQTIEQLKIDAQKQAEEGKEVLDQPNNSNNDGGEIDNTLPLWMSKMILNDDNYAPSVRCDYLGEKYYIGFNREVDCRDCYTDQVYNRDGVAFCSTGGGLSGRGDGGCPDFDSMAGNCQIWNGERWEKTIWSGAMKNKVP